LRIATLSRGLLAALALALPATPAVAADTYTNPLPTTIPGTDQRVETFADPHVIRGHDGAYYAYGTTDPLNDEDRDEAGDFRFHRIPTMRSTDLVNWTYVGDAFTEAPEWLDPDSPQWAPDVRYLGGRYVLFYTAVNTDQEVSGQDCDFDPAIGAATSPSPTGPWTDIGRPVVAPRRGSEDPCNFFWTFDPAVVTEPDGSAHLYYGSYYGGVQVRDLDVQALTTDPATATQVVIPNRYEGTYVVRRGQFYYLMGSATDCCRGPLTGYSVFAGRSLSPRGPFLDRLGVPLTASRVGGTPVISMNGNRWVGPGHNSVITDAAGQDWFVYHAIDRGDPYLAQPNPLNINKRPMLLDRLDWVLGWPSVRAGRWASDEPQPAPVTEEGGERRPVLAPLRNDAPGRRIASASDEFESATLKRGWSWVREPAAELVPGAGVLRFPVQVADIAESPGPAEQGGNGLPLASLLVRDLPRGDLLIETKFRFDLPPDIQANFAQAGVGIYLNDDAFVRIAHVAIFETRQTEWAKEVPEVITLNNRRYGNTVIGPPAQPEGTPATTWLRIVRRGDRYTGYSSIDGRRWVRGGTWTHSLQGARLALFSLGALDEQAGGRVADFDYVRVHRLAE
jgi:arabinan endo-1,5-alpha-L-arabinosidase